MKKLLVFCLFAVGLVSVVLVVHSDSNVLPFRWVRVGARLRSDKDLEQIQSIIQTASEHGLNGIMLSGGLDTLDLQPPEFKQRLATLRRICEEAKIDIIPSIFSTGYGSALMARNKNLAEGLPVRDALYVVKGKEARLEPDPPTPIRNGGFENVQGKQLDGFELNGEIGTTVFLDTSTKRSGKSSLRFENFDRQPEGLIRLSQTITVHPYRNYRISCWVKSENLVSPDQFGEKAFQLEVFGGEEKRRLQYENPRLGENDDWHQVAVGFNSWGYDKVIISPAVTGVAKSRFWIDDLQVEEVGLLNVLRRPGTPLEVRSEKTGVVYEEGKDYAPISDPNLNYRYDHDGPPIKLVEGGRIKEGERLRVSFYHPVLIYNSQVPACLSEAEPYEIWAEQARLIHEALAPRFYFLSADEQRALGTCKACADRRLSLGEIMGDCITRQYKLIKAVNPDAEVLVWSDMLDPNHNADKRDYYYLTSGNFYGAWNHVPKDLIIGCWHYRRRDVSLKHFSELGFRTLAAAYYDADDLENPKGWLKSLEKTPRAVGIMYTTWLRKYDLLAEFGDLVSGKK
ncbi:MAG TPA: hypothetical protein PLP42_20500 [Acidobacteriota bacterium]|mgnify:CR=1 FL=1|nr:hypothetical protein [Acidobacteriota bacterium]